MTLQTQHKNRIKFILSQTKDTGFDEIVGFTKMWNLFGEQTDEIIYELYEALAA